VEATLELAAIWLVELILLPVHHTIIIHWAPHHLSTHMWVVTLVLHLLLRISIAILVVLTVLALASKGSVKVIGIEFLPTEVVHLLDNVYVRNVINYGFSEITRLKAINKPRICAKLFNQI
tara:strand:- start:101 stop:463 length:363 start_codon:yes stop_codon:yes gene_type:complete